MTDDGRYVGEFCLSLSDHSLYRKSSHSSSEDPNNATSPHSQAPDETSTQPHSLISHPCLVCYDIFYGEASSKVPAGSHYSYQRIHDARNIVP